MVYEFDTFRADFDRRQVFRGNDEVHLSPKALQLLELLIERRPKALSKGEIQDCLWPATFVVESNLATLINELRRAIGDSARTPRYIRTVHGYGYAFNGDPQGGQPQPERRTPVARLVSPDGILPLYSGRNVIGRDSEAAVQIDDRAVSRHHAVVILTGETALIEDLGSKNGTFVNEVRVTGPVELNDGSVVEIGSVRLVFRSDAGSTSTTTLFR